MRRVLETYFPREIQGSNLDKSSATKLPLGNIVWQSGQGERSNLTEGTDIKLLEGLCSSRPDGQTKFPVGSFGSAGRILFTSLNFLGKLGFRCEVYIQSAANMQLAISFN